MEVFMAGEQKKLTLWEKVAYAFGDCGVTVYVGLSGLATAYYTDTVHIAALAIGTMMLVTRIFDGITDLIMGSIVDKTRSRWGKARPWLLWTAPFFAIGMVALFAIPESFYGKNSALVYAYISYILFACFIYTANSLPYQALLARMTLDVQDRASAVSIRGILGNICSQGVTAITAILVARNLGWRMIASIFAVISFVFFILCFLGCKEHVGEAADSSGPAKAEKIPLSKSLPSLLKNPYFFLELLAMLLSYLYINGQNTVLYYYCRWILGNIAFVSTLSIITMVSNILGSLVFPYFTKKTGKRTCMFISCITIIVGSLMVAFWGSNIALLSIATFIRGLGWIWLWAGIFALPADIVDYGEWKTGVRAEGLISSCVSVGQKVGLGVGAVVGSAFLAAGGYDGAAATQSESALGWITFGYGYYPVICCVVIMIILIFLNVDKYMGQVEHDLKAKAAAGK